MILRRAGAGRGRRASSNSTESVTLGGPAQGRPDSQVVSRGKSILTQPLPLPVGTGFQIIAAGADFPSPKFKYPAVVPGYITLESDDPYYYYAYKFHAYIFFICIFLLHIFAYICY